MHSQYKTFGYHITTDPNFQNERMGNTAELFARFEGLHQAAINKKDKKIISKLTDLIVKYPRSPQLKNFLSVAYHVQGNQQKAQEVNKWILTEHPDYLFAKINTANEYINTGHPVRVPEVLGEAMEIKGLYPERDLFHLAEVTGFCKVAIRYYVAIKNLDLAENRLEVLMEIAPDHPDTVAAELLLTSLRMEENLKSWKKEDDAKITVDCVKPVPQIKTETAPVFNHPEIINLYTWGIEIPTEALQEILALDRETIIADLEKVLQDAADRYLHFNNPDDQEEAYDFPLHAICLLGELKSESSLPAVLSFLENDEEVLDFWLGDHINETIWKPLYSLSQNSLGLLKQFLLKPGINANSKIAISDVLAEIATHQPQKRDEIITIYKEVFTHFLQADLKDNLIDSDYLGLAIGKAIDCGFIELLPLIKELYNKGYVDLSINGNYEDVEKFFNDSSEIKEKYKIENIFEIYEDILNTWDSLSDIRDDLEYDDYEEENIRQPAAVANKIGRNDPCPCGSGKKFKKCCLGKLLL